VISSAIGKTGSTQPGLTSAEVAARRQQGLTNAVQIKTSRSLRDIVMGNVFNPPNLMLYVIGIGMILTHDVGSSLGAVGLVLINTLVGIAQEVSVKRQLDKIALLTQIKVKVVRDGDEQLIDPGDIVLGDVLVLQPGDQIPVDGELLDGSKIEVDESALTGESDLVPKTGGERVLSGSFCVTGTGLVQATGVGESSFANSVTKNARQFKLERTPLQRDVSRLLRFLLLVVLNLILLAMLSLLVTDIPLPVWLRALSVIAGMVSAGLLTLITLNYSWGAVRIAQKGALAQQINAVEALSNVTVLCCDKTGTLTTNKIQYQETYPIGMERRTV
jgi:cation-transporting ATPase E